MAARDFLLGSTALMALATASAQESSGPEMPRPTRAPNTQEVQLANNVVNDILESNMCVKDFNSRALANNQMSANIRQHDLNTVVIKWGHTDPYTKESTSECGGLILDFDMHLRSKKIARNIHVAQAALGAQNLTIKGLVDDYFLPQGFVDGNGQVKHWDPNGQQRELLPMNVRAYADTVATYEGPVQHQRLPIQRPTSWRPQ